MIYVFIIFIAILFVFIITIAYIIRLVWPYSIVAPLLQPEHNAEIRVGSATLRAWPTFTYAEARSQDPRVVDASCCSVCLVDYEEAEDKALRLLPQCGHLFHATCVDPWLQRRQTCPVCRSLVVDGAMQMASAEVIPIEIEQT